MKRKLPSIAVRALATLATEMWNEGQAERFVVISSPEEVEAAIEALRACKKDITASALEDLVERIG
jgi:HEAT repeat protein